MSKIIITTIVILFNLTFFINPTEIISATRNGINIWLYNIVPIMLPTIAFNNLLLKSKSFSAIPNFIFFPIKKIFNISYTSSKFYIMALLSGYPIGIKISCDLYNNNYISKDEYISIIGFFNNAGMIFVINTIGNIFFKSKFIGIYLYTIHILSSAIVGIIFRPKLQIKAKNYNSTSTSSSIFSDSINDAMETVVKIGGYIIFFSSIGKIIEIYNISTFIHIPFITNNQLTGVILGLLEFTNGIYYLANSEHNTFTLPLVSLVLGFGGLSVLLQSFFFLDSFIRIKYLYYKIMHGILGFILTLSTSSFFTDSLVSNLDHNPTDNMLIVFKDDTFFTTPILVLLTLSMLQFLIYLYLSYSVKKIKYKKYKHY